MDTYVKISLCNQIFMNIKPKFLSVSPREIEFWFCLGGNMKTLSQKIASWMIPTRQFPPGKLLPKKITTQDNSHPENPQPKNPNKCNPPNLTKFNNI